MAQIPVFKRKFFTPILMDEKTVTFRGFGSGSSWNLPTLVGKYSYFD